MNEKELPRLSYEMIQNITNPTYFQRGEEYQKSGMVNKGWIIEDGIKAKVRGNYKPYYLVEIIITDTMELTGRCTCPVGFGCKHSVAGCLQFLYEPEFFIRLDSQKSSSTDLSEQQTKKKLKVPKEYELKSISVQDWVSTLPPEVLKSKFIELWENFAPNTFKNLLDPDYPYNFWIYQLIDINDIDQSINEMLKNKNSKKWFTPLELLEFFNDSDLLIPILYNWTQSYIDLGKEIKEELNAIGISKNLIEFDLEFYFLDDYNDEYENSWDYDYNIENDPESLADVYFSQYREIFKEIGRFFGTLQYENLSDLTNNLLDFGYKWFLDLNLLEHRDYGLNELYKIQQKFDEKVQSIQAANLKGKNRIDFLVEMYLKFESEDLKKNIIKELKQLPINNELEQKIKDVWQKIFEKYKIEMTIKKFLFLLELSDNFSQDKKRTHMLLKNSLLNVKKHDKYPYAFIDAIFNHFGMISNENMEWLYFFIIKGEINRQKIIDISYDKTRKFLCSYCFEWFLKYFLPKGDFTKIAELCEYVLNNDPSTFRFNHYSMIKNYSKNDSAFKQKFFPFLNTELLPGLIKKRQYDTAIKINLNQNDYPNAISLTHSHFNIDRAWRLIKKIHTAIIIKKSVQSLKTISKEDFLLFIKILNRYINESMKLKSRYRPDSNISQGVQLSLRLYEYFKIQSEGKKWFTQFCRKYKRFYNLRSSLKSFGIEMV